MNSSRLAPQPRRAQIAGLILLLLFAALYLVTLDDGLRPGELQGGDLITHQYAQVQGRFSNAPGYPLYTMGGWLWFHAGRLLLGPDFNPIRILSSYSTLWALIALALLYRLCLLVGEPKKPGFSEKPGFFAAWPIAFLVTAFFGLTYFFWYYAVTTEQYTSSVAWTLAVVLLAFQWEETRSDRYLLALALLMGVGLAHQITVLAVLPPLLWFVLSKEPSLLRRGRLVAAALALALLPLLSYSFVYVRGAQHPEWRGAGEWASTWQWFLSFISTSQGRGELTWSLRPFFTAEFPALIWREVTWPGLLAGLGGIAALGRRRAVLLYATIAIYFVFCWIDRLGNWYQVIMPVYALLALGLAAGAHWLLRLLAARQHPERSPAALSEVEGLAGRSHRRARRRMRFTYAAVLLALVALAAYRGVISYPRAHQNGRPDDAALAPGWAILADNPPNGTLVLGTQEEALSLNYLTEIWGRRSDLRTINTAGARALLSHALIAVTRAALPIVPQEISPDLHYSAVGPTLAAIQPQPPTEVPPSLLPLSHTFGDQLQLLGVRAHRNALGQQVVLLTWAALRKPDDDWSVSVRLVDGDKEISQQDRTAPVNGAYPTTRWTAGEVVTDAYAFDLPADAAPDGLTVILYRQGENGQFINLDVARLPLRIARISPNSAPFAEFAAVP